MALSQADLAVFSAIGMAESIDVARADFELLSEQIETLLRVFGNPLETPVRHAYCSMAFDNRGAYWIQPGEVIDNAYFGDQMRQCGEIKATVGQNPYLMGYTGMLLLYGSVVPTDVPSTNEPLGHVVNSDVDTGVAILTISLDTVRKWFGVRPESDTDDCWR